MPCASTLLSHSVLPGHLRLTRAIEMPDPIGQSIEAMVDEYVPEPASLPAKLNVYRISRPRLDGKFQSRIPRCLRPGHSRRANQPFELSR